MKDLQYAQDIVLQFTSRINEWENKMYIFSRLERRQFVSEKDKNLVKGQSKDSLDRYYYKILDLFCTDKERKYGGHPYSYGKPTKYSGIKPETIIQVEQTKSNRIEVTAKSDYFFETIYRFVLLKKRGEWKIDSLKVKRENKWENTFL